MSSSWWNFQRDRPSDLELDPEVPTQILQDSNEGEGTVENSGEDLLTLVNNDVNPEATQEMMDEEFRVPYAVENADVNATTQVLQDEDVVDTEAPTQVLEESDNEEEVIDTEAPTQVLENPGEFLNISGAEEDDTAINSNSEVDPEASTQVLEKQEESLNISGAEEDDIFNSNSEVDPEASTQVIANIQGNDGYGEYNDEHDDEEVEERESVIDSDPEDKDVGCRSRSITPSSLRAQSHSGSRSRSVSTQSGRSRSGSPAMASRSRSRSSSSQRSYSRSQNPQNPGTRSRSGTPRSRNTSPLSHSSRSRSGSRSTDRHRSRSGSPVSVKSPSRSSGDGENIIDDDSVGRAKKRVVREAFGSDDDGSGKEDTVASNDGSMKARKKIRKTVMRSDGEEEEIEVEVTDAEDNGPRPGRSADAADSSDDGVGTTPGGVDSSGTGGGVCDFDLMLERKKSEMRRRRRKKDIDLINDNDDAIAKMIADMRLAAREDRELNTQRLPATKKISMLPTIMTQLNKADLQMAFVEANVLSVLTEWLAPMPDKSLPSVAIRGAILKLLLDLRIEDNSRLKESGIGKAVMYLYKHPKELRCHKELAGKIINAWARPIFHLSTDYKNLSKEERMRRDENLERHGGGGYQEEKAEPDETGMRPGDPGWCYRARVPRVASKTYVNRPEWTSDVDISCVKKKSLSRLDKHARVHQEMKRNAKTKRAIQISIEGRKMSL